MKEQELLHMPAPRADELSFHVEECGSGNATCLLLHGFGEGRYVWYDFAPRLPKKYRAVMMDFRGHGNAGEDPAGDFGAGPYSTDVLDLVRRYKLRKISLVGHSLGAAVALRVAATAPDLVRDLILVDLSLSTEPAVSENILSQFHEQCDGYDSLAEYAAWISDKRPLTHPRMLRHIVDNALRETTDGRFVLNVDRRIQQILTSGATRTDDVRTMLSKVRCRTLLIRGEFSAVLCRKDARDLVRLLQDGQLREISHAGHAVMAEAPDAFAEAVNQFLLGPRTSRGRR